MTAIAERSHPFGHDQITADTYMGYRDAMRRHLDDIHHTLAASGDALTPGINVIAYDVQETSDGGFSDAAPYLSLVSVTPDGRPQGVVDMFTVPNPMPESFQYVVVSRIFVEEETDPAAIAGLQQAAVDVLTVDPSMAAGDDMDLIALTTQIPVPKEGVYSELFRGYQTALENVGFVQYVRGRDDIYAKPIHNTAQSSAAPLERSV